MWSMPSGMTYFIGYPLTESDVQLHTDMGNLLFALDTNFVLVNTAVTPADTNATVAAIMVNFTSDLTG